MTLVSTLMGGVAAIVIVFVSLYIMTPIKGARIALIVSVITLGLYIPYAILQWQGGDVFAIHLGVYLVTCYLLGIITSYRDERKASGEEMGKWFHWGPAAIVSFFVVIVVFDSIFVTIAQQGLSPEMAEWLLPEPKSRKEKSVQTNFPGVVERDYNLKNSDLDEYQKRLKEQQKLGWTVNRGWLDTNEPRVGESAVFQVQISDKDNQPVDAALLEGKFLRLSDHRMDFDFIMIEQEPGLYQTSVSFPAPGRWNVYLRISRNEQIHEIQAATQVGIALQ